MRPVRRFFRRLGAWATTEDRDERLLAEIEDHLAHQTAENERAGLSPAEARRQAVLKFGAIEATRERWREERGLPALRLTSFFGLLSLALASIGLYGVTAFNAGCRVNEIGVRLALGATRGQVVRLVVSGAFRLILVGLIVGLPLTYAVGLFLGAQLYGTNPFNPAVVLSAALALAVSAAFASWMPAFRASLTSPVEALRAE